MNTDEWMHMSRSTKRERAAKAAKPAVDDTTTEPDDEAAEDVAAKDAPIKGARARRFAVIGVRLLATIVIAALALVFTLLVLYIDVVAVTPALGVFTGNAFGDVSSLDAAGQTAYFYAPFAVLVIVVTAGVVALLRRLLGVALDLARRAAPTRGDLATLRRPRAVEQAKAAKPVKPHRLRRSNAALLRVVRAGWWCVAFLAAACALYAVALYVVPGLGELTHRLLYTTYSLTPQGMAVYWYAPYLLLLAAALYGIAVAGMAALKGVRWVSDAIARRIRTEHAADEAAKHDKES